MNKNHFRNWQSIQDPEIGLSGQFRAYASAGQAATARVSLPVQLAEGQPLKTQEFFVLSNVFQIDALLTHLAACCVDANIHGGAMVRHAVENNDPKAGWVIDERALVTLGKEAFAACGREINVDLTNVPHLQAA